jgi:hypothetical protein
MLSRVNKFKLNKINLCRLYRSATDNIPSKVEEQIVGNINDINNVNNHYKKQLGLLITHQMETNKYLKHISQDINDSTHKTINKLEYANERLLEANKELYYISRAIPIIQMIIGTLILIKI